MNLDSHMKYPSIPRDRISLCLLTALIAAGAIIFWNFTSSPRPTKLVDVCKPSCVPADALYRQTGVPVDQRIEDLLSRMTEAEKIGQLALVEKNSIQDPDDITRYGLGAILSGAGGNPEPNTPAAWLDMVRGLQEHAQATRLGIPLLYGVDAVHGHTNVIEATVFPHAIGLGAAHDADLVYRVAQATTQEMVATGIHWNFSPNLDVVKDSRWGRTYESYGSDTDLVARLGRAFVEGTQSSSSSDRRAIATAKHYLGAGAMAWGSSSNPDFEMDQGDTQVEEAILRRDHLPPFKAAIEAGVPVVMIGLNSWNGSKLSTSHFLLTDLLKDELGFQGMVVSDWYGVYEIPGGDYQALVTAINAGVDMVMLPFDYRTFADNFHKALTSGDIDSKRLDDAVRRVLRAKFTAGLFENPSADGSGLAEVGSPAHRTLAREAVSKSVVVLQDRRPILPLSTDVGHIIVAGSSSHNLGRQMGGWSIEWQGIDGNWVSGTTILDGIKAVVSPSTFVDQNPDGLMGQSGKKADVGIAVVGESPYAEGWGDKAHPSLSDEDLSTIRRIQAASKRLLVIIVSGRPLEFPPEASQWDVIVAVWLPGSEGAGVADAIFGSTPITGTLPLPWLIK